MIVAERIRALLKNNDDTSRQELGELLAREITALHNRCNTLEAELHGRNTITAP